VRPLPDLAGALRWLPPARVTEASGRERVARQQEPAPMLAPELVLRVPALLLVRGSGLARSQACAAGPPTAR